MIEEKKSVLRFRKKYKLKRITADVLRDIIEQQGYTVVPYNSVYKNATIFNIILKNC